MHAVFYGMKYQDQSGGLLGSLYDDLTGLPVTFEDMCAELASGQQIVIRPATVADTHKMEAMLAIVKAQQSATLTEWATKAAQA
jgi:hypothetical protein